MKWIGIQATQPTVPPLRVSLTARENYFGRRRYAPHGNPGRRAGTTLKRGLS